MIRALALVTLVAGSSSSPRTEAPASGSAATGAGSGSWVATGSGWSAAPVQFVTVRQR